MVREPNATMQPAPHDDQLMSKHRVLSLKPQLRLEWRGQDGQNETEQPDHSASLGDSITASTRIRFSVHTGVRFKGLGWRVFGLHAACPGLSFQTWVGPLPFTSMSCGPSNA